MKEWVRKHCSDDVEDATCFQWLEQVVETKEIPVHEHVIEGQGIR